MSERHRTESCGEYARWSRRSLLKRGATTAAALASAPSWLPAVARAANAAPNPHDTLLLVFLRGGLDGLTAVAPYGDPGLYAARPNLAVRAPGQTNGAIDLDGFFGLAPAAAPLRDPFLAGELAIVHACGSPDPSRSHFDAMAILEQGTPNQPGVTLTSGWLGRHLATVGSTALLRAVALEQLLPRALSGAPKTLPLLDPAAFVMPGAGASAASRRALLSAMYAGEAELGGAALDTFATIDLLGEIDFEGYAPSNGAQYPDHDFGQKLKAAAALIKADTGVLAIEADFDGWDLHANLGPFDGPLAEKLDVLARALQALWKDLGSTMQRTMVVVLSEFGRRVAENGSGGTDHGHGNCMLVMGGHAAGGQVIRQWPGLAPANLDQGDLAITIDYRDLLSEILWTRLGCTQLSTVFPGYSPVFRGVTV